MWNFIVLIQLLAVYSITTCGSAVPDGFIEPCKVSDAACIQSSTKKAIPVFVAGIPELGTEVLDPMNLEKIDFDLSGLRFKLDNAKMKGLKTVVLDRISMNADKKMVEMDFHLQTMSIRGHYVAGGQVLILPIEGDGDFKLSCKDVRVSLKIPYNTVNGPDGKERIEVKPFKHTYEVVGNAHFTLTNLFKGNKQLSDAMHNFLNESWSLVVKEFGEPIMDVAVKQMYKNIKMMFSKIPADELFL